jgi:hypothetical protein
VELLNSEDLSSDLVENGKKTWKTFSYERIKEIENRLKQEKSKKLSSILEFPDSTL